MDTQQTLEEQVGHGDQGEAPHNFKHLPLVNAFANIGARNSAAQQQMNFDNDHHQMSERVRHLAVQVDQHLGNVHLLFENGVLNQKNSAVGVQEHLLFSGLSEQHRAPEVDVVVLVRALLQKVPLRLSEQSQLDEVGVVVGARHTLVSEEDAQIDVARDGEPEIIAVFLLDGAPFGSRGQVARHEHRAVLYLLQNASKDLPNLPPPVECHAVEYAKQERHQSTEHQPSVCPKAGDASGAPLLRAKRLADDVCALFAAGRADDHAEERGQDH
mmetsp:Transcript_3775/g.7187  ORF Transcript_3775/g.7187 Transcript_3775/m.7187 type:complete len:271 (-) Transcript_3775:1250-2062(-)